MAVHLIYLDFLRNFQLLFECHIPVNWSGEEVIRKIFLVAFCLKQIHWKKKSLGIILEKILEKTNFPNIVLRKGGNYHLVLD